MAQTASPDISFSFRDVGHQSSLEDGTRRRSSERKGKMFYGGSLLTDFKKEESWYRLISSGWSSEWKSTLYRKIEFLQI